MRKFLFLLACAFSFCVHAETNIVQITPEQFAIFQRFSNLFIQSVINSPFIEQNNDGSISFSDEYTDFNTALSYMQYNQYNIAMLLHLLLTGDLDGSYDTSNNNILAYASSLRGYLNSYSNSVQRLDHDVSIYLPSIRQLVQGLYNDRYYTGYKVLELTTLQRNNFERLYDIITNIDFKVSISNQIDLLQVMNGNLSNLDGILQDWSGNQQANFQMVVDHMHRDHGELMEFLHSFSNYQDSVITMLDWMTNNFPDVAESPIGGGGGSNNVWSIWRPNVPTSAFNKLFVPTVAWEETNDGNHRPFYGDFQYDSEIGDIWEQYLSLLENYRADGIDGQQFLAGLVDLQLHIMANMSTQLYMIDSKLPSKTNLWDWIESYKRTISDEVTKAEQENSEIVSSVSYLLDYTPFGIVGGHFPKVSSALNSLRLEQGASPVLRIPIPSVLRVSDSDALVVDVRESEWFTTGRTWCRWIFTFIWGWLFIRLGIVPIFYVFFFTVRVAEISAHLVFMGSVRGSSGIVSSFGAAAVDMVLSLIGIDTDFKKFVWGIMRD